MKIETTANPEKDGNAILQNSVPVKMMLSCVISCVIGIVLMAVISRYWLMAFFISELLCVAITTKLYASGKISIHTACLVPMLLLCFVYTPLSWFSFDGLLGCTLYISILFITVITLTYYDRVQIVLLSLYGALLAGLILHWLLTWTGERDVEQIVNILVAYVLAAALVFFTIESVKRKNMEITHRIADLSLRDDLTGLQNRRAIEQTLAFLGSGYEEGGSEYALVMLDIDDFKRINDEHGHHLGDSVLKSIAEAIRRCIRSEDYAFRFGGDEFLLVLPHVDNGIAHQICTRIEAAVQDIQGYAFPLSISVGHALRSECNSTGELLALADQRMYQVKRSHSGDAQQS